MSLNWLIAQCYNNAIFRQDSMGLDWKHRLTIAGHKGFGHNGFGHKDEFDEAIICLSVHSEYF